MKEANKNEAKKYCKRFEAKIFYTNDEVILLEETEKNWKRTVQNIIINSLKFHVPNFSLTLVIKTLLVSKNKFLKNDRFLFFFTHLALKA